MSSSRMIDSRWMSIRDFATKYELPLRTAQRYAEEGHIPSKKMGPRGAWYVDINAWNKKVEIYKEQQSLATEVIDLSDKSIRKTKGI